MVVLIDLFSLILSLATMFNVKNTAGLVTSTLLAFISFYFVFKDIEFFLDFFNGDKNE